MKWCPSPGCDYACENPDLSERIVTCKCGTSFCFKCGEENHEYSNFNFFSKHIYR